jgi:tripartite-type tricarboxylate transporter receptor subunit TctC
MILTMSRLLALVLFVLAAGASAQYPAKPIRLIVTYPPGGGADTMARIIAPRLAERLGQQVLVENKAGASGQIGADLVAKSAADGYTILFDATAFSVNPSLYPKLPYDTMKDFAPITILIRVPNILVVTPGFAPKSVQELVALAKAKPGQLSYASSGSGSAQHLAAELFKVGTGTDIVHIPYKGGAPAIADVMGGQVPMFFSNMSSSLPHVRSGRVRALAVTGSKRSANAPELPTIAESGVPGYEVYEWNGLFAPAGTPAAIVNRLQAEIAMIVRLPEVSEKLAALGAEAVANTPQEATAFLKAEIAKWATVVKHANIKAE